MWIVTNKGFMSIVAKGRDGKVSPAGLDAVISVRFRRPKDAKALFPEHEVVLTAGGDYACRIFATRAEVAEVMFRETVGVNYTNFKSSIPASDAALNSAAHKAWDVFGALQEGGPYGRDAHRQQAYPSRSPYLPGEWDDPVWRLPAKAPEAKAKARKAKRSDPFCDGCGMRHGVKHLDADGYCFDCAAILQEKERPRVRSGEGPEWSPDAEEARSGGPGECWNCATYATVRNRWKLCEGCAGEYEGTDPELLDSIVAGLHAD